MKRMISLLLAVVLCYLPLTVSAAGVDYDALLDEYLCSKGMKELAEQVEVGQMITKESAYSVKKDSTIAELWEQGDAKEALVLSDGEAVGTADFWIKEGKWVCTGYSYEPKQRLLAYLEQFGENAVFLYYVNGMTVIFDPDTPKTVYLNLYPVDYEQPVIQPSNLSYEDYILCMSCETDLMRKKAGVMTALRGSYDAGDVAYARKYWSDPDFRDEMLFGKIESPTAVYLSLAVIAVVILTVVLLIRNHRKRKKQRNE